MTFQVKKSSWHYRWMDWLGIPHGNDFCEYWRMFVISNFFLLGLSAIACLLTSWLISVPYHLIWGGVSEDWLVLGSLLWLLIIVASIFATLNYFQDYLFDKLLNRKKEPKPDGILKTKYKAWKGKYCPMVEFIDE